MTPTEATHLVRGSTWAERLKPRAGAVAGLLVEGATEFVTLGQGVDATTPMEVGSVTKGFTGLLLAQAVERGEAMLDTRVDEAVLGERWPGEPAITLGQLATHTSGLPRLSMPPQVGLIGDPYRWFGDDHLRRFLRRHMPRSPAAPRFGYSNLGFALLGLALEQAAGTPFPELLQQRVLAPLGLEHTRLQMVGGGDLVAGGYNLFGRRAKPWHFRAYAACGAMVSCAGDLVRAMDALSDPAGPLAGSVALAAEPRVESKAGWVGLAWMRPTAGDWVWHNGGTYGYQAYVAFSRRRRVGVALLANQYGAQPMTVLGHTLMRGLLDASDGAAAAGLS